MRVIEGLTRYFRDLSVGGSLLNNVTGWRQKVRLFYADDDFIDTSRSIELDATTNISVSLDTDLLRTPAENQVVYTMGALKKPKRIDITCHLDVTKLEKLNAIWENMIPVYVMTEKSLSGVITQVGYWADSSKYGIVNITQNDTGYDNTVYVTISLEELRLYSYNREYTYNLKTNTIKKIDKSSNSETQGKVVNAYGNVFDRNIENVKKNELSIITKNGGK